MVVLKALNRGCACKAYGECKCSAKPAKKQVRKETPAAMYKNDAGTAFALSYIASEVGRNFGHMFGAFTIEEVDGKLVIHTGMVRDEHMEDLIARSCKQPCRGSCEDGCAAQDSSREVGRL